MLDAQEGVLESAVIGVPHPDFGETVLALFVPSSEHTPDLDAIQSHISEHLARFKLPKKLIILSHLPRNTMGKVQKNTLRDQFRDVFSKSLSASKKSGSPNFPNAPAGPILALD